MGASARKFRSPGRCSISLKTLSLLSFCLAVLLVLSHSTHAADDPITTAGLLDLFKKKPKATPPSSGNRIAVIGDSLAQDLWFGLSRRYRKNNNVKILKFTKSATGLVRDDVYDWKEKLSNFIQSESFDIAIVVMGGNDRQPIRTGGKRLNRRTKAWLKEYRARVDRLMKTLKSETRHVFWVGLPIVQSAGMARDFSQFNNIYASSAKAHRINYIDVWQLFRDENGDYTSFGPDVRGVERRLRNDDGLHFTVAGQNRLAQVVAKHILRSIKLSTRVMPLPANAMRMASSPSIEHYPLTNPH